MRRVSNFCFLTNPCLVLLFLENRPPAFFHHFVASFNISQRDGNTQELKCFRSGCENRSGDIQTGTTSNTQNTFCANSNSCLNDGTNTKIISNGADCKSNGPDTTTICQPGHTIIQPNP